MGLYDLDADLYGVAIDTNTDTNPDFDINVYAVLGQNDQVTLVHDAPFQKTLSWVEYHAKTHAIRFVMEDGDARDFGIALTPDFQEFLVGCDTIAVAEINGTDLIGGNMYQLLIHGYNPDGDYEEDA